MTTKKKEDTLEVEEEKVLTPSEYFEMLKEKRQEVTEEELQKLIDAALKLMNTYKITGQKSGAMKLYNYVKLCEKEILAVRAGINTYVNRTDIDTYIADIASKEVVIIELENFERDIPDDVVEKIAALKEANIFDEYFVVFTDYTGKERKKVEQKKRDKDPILFGAMKIQNQLNMRMYYIASWVDEYCDLTLDKMIKEYAEKHPGESISRDIMEQYKTVDAFKESFNKYKADKN